MWWPIPQILVFRTQRQEKCHGIEANLGYLINSRPAWSTVLDPSSNIYLPTTTKKKKKDKDKGAIRITQ